MMGMKSRLVRPLTSLENTLVIHPPRADSSIRWSAITVPVLMSCWLSWNAPQYVVAITTVARAARTAAWEGPGDSFLRLTARSPSIGCLLNANEPLCKEIITQKRPGHSGCWIPKGGWFHHSWVYRRVQIRPSRVEVDRDASCGAGVSARTLISVIRREALGLVIRDPSPPPQLELPCPSALSVVKGLSPKSATPGAVVPDTLRFPGYLETLVTLTDKDVHRDLVETQAGTPQRGFGCG